MSEKVYTIEEIKEMIYDILKKGNLKTLLQLSALANEIKNMFYNEVDRSVKKI